jgi:hypothetical protein
LFHFGFVEGKVACVAREGTVKHGHEQAKRKCYFFHKAESLIDLGLKDRKIKGQAWNKMCNYPPSLRSWLKIMPAISRRQGDPPALVSVCL